MKIVNTIIGAFTFDQAQRFRRKYQEAYKRNEEIFVYSQTPVSVSFVKHVVELLESEFNLKSED